MKLLNKRRQMEVLGILTSLQIYAGIKKEEMGEADFNSITKAIGEAATDVAGERGLAVIVKRIDEWKRRNNA